MSDEEEYITESEPDFSASEDEWVPETLKSQGSKRSQKNKRAADSDESDDSELEEEEEEDDDDSIDSEDEQLSDEVNAPAKRKRSSKKTSGARKRPKRESGKAKTFTFQNKHRKLFLKYKSPTKPGTSSGGSTGVSTSLTEILKKSEFKAKKLSLSQATTAAAENDSDDDDSTGVVNNENTSQVNKPPKPKNLDDSDSESSVDDYLVKPDQLDFNSEFFAKPAQESAQETKDAPPKFDCSGGVKMSDESDDDNMEAVPDSVADDSDKRKTSTTISKINQQSSGVIDLQENFRFNQNLESAKEQLKQIQTKNFANTGDEVNVEQLLMMGEEVAATVSSSKTEKSKPAQSGKKRKKLSQDSESDWEDVEIAGKKMKIKQSSLLNFVSKTKI